MATLEIQNNAPDGIVISNPLYQDETFTAAGVETWLRGTLLARNSVSGNVVPYVSGGANGTNIPKFVIREEEIFTGAGSRPGRPLISGVVRFDDLIAFGVGAITKSEGDLLRDFTIVSLTTQQLANLDNQ